jgi:DNA-binding CsgD family transcriptional regulator/DNA polymerase III delta prime subunit
MRVTSGIVGREEEVAALHGFLDQEAEGPRALVLEGQAGIGKSTLWLAGVARARERGYRVLLSRPAEAERELAYAGLGDLFEAALSEIGPTLSPARRQALEAALLVGEVSDPVDPRALGVAVRNGLESLAAGAPLLVAVDDVQWLDRASSSGLSFAVRRLEGPVLFLLARRVETGIESSELERALGPDALQALPVGPLSLGATQALLRAHATRGFSRPLLLRLHEASGGNPFYALELARALGPELDATQPLPVPDTLEGLVEARLSGLPDETRDALVLAAAVGAPSATLLRSAGIAEALLEPAVAAGVIELRDGACRFTHPLLSSVLYRGLSIAEKRDLHGVLAEVVQEPVERARHRALATERPDADVAATLDEAAETAAARGAMALALELREHALRLTPAAAADDVHRRTLAAARGHLTTASVDRARALIREALDRAPPGVRRAEALLVAADASSRRAGILKQALAEAGERPALQVSILERLGWDARFSEGLRSAEEYARRALEISEKLDDHSARAGALATFSATRFHLAEADALSLAERAYDVARATADPELVRDVALRVSSTFMWMGLLDRARALLEPLHRDWSERDEGFVGQIEWRFACIDLAKGRLAEAAEHAERAFDIDADYGGSDVAATWALANIAALRGELDRAQELVLARRDEVEEVPWFTPHLELVLGLVAQQRGSLDEGATHFAAAEAALAVVGSREPNLARWRADYVEVLLELGHVDDAIALLEPWESEAARLGREPVLAQAMRCRGLVAAARGDVDLARALLEEAAARHAAVGDRLGAARALLALGVVLRRARQKRASREAIEEAIRVFDECGAVPFADKAREELGRIGGRRREEGLTAAERRVASLVAEGRTNREVAAALFLGERTVETHLSHIYAKLGVRSRTELARIFQPAS